MHAFNVFDDVSANINLNFFEFQKILTIQTKKKNNREIRVNEGALLCRWFIYDDVYLCDHLEEKKMIKNELWSI